MRRAVPIPFLPGLIIAAAVLGTAAVAASERRTDAAAEGSGHTTDTGAAAITGARVRLGEPALAPSEAPVPGARPHAFYFTRAAYSGGRGWGRRGSWAIDYPKADSQFLIVLSRLTDVDAYPGANAMTLDDPDLRRFPFLYALEVGAMSLSPPEVRGLRNYLLAGGFLVIDDFWGTWEWQNFEREIRQVLPEFSIVELPLEHEVFSTFYSIDRIEQVPSINNARRGQTHEKDGFVPHVRAIFNDEGRLLVVINWNTDLGDAWEWAEQPDYPLKYSTFAMQMGVNLVVYAMSH